MDRKIQKIKNQPDYKRIYTDLIKCKFPEKHEHYSDILKKDHLSVLEVIQLNNLLFKKDLLSVTFNQKFRSYDKETILKILQYQKANNLNNSELAIFFKLSRNTVTRWKKLFYKVI